MRFLINGSYWKNYGLRDERKKCPKSDDWDIRQGQEYQHSKKIPCNTYLEFQSHSSLPCWRKFLAFSQNWKFILYLRTRFDENESWLCIRWGVFITLRNAEILQKWASRYNSFESFFLNKSFILEITCTPFLLYSIYNLRNFCR